MFVEAPAPSPRVDPAHRRFVGIFAADTDAEDEPAGCSFRQTGQLPSDRHRVPQRQQVDGDVDGQRLVQHR